MSATLATMLHEFDNSLEIVIFERLSEVAKESSSAWNNAGTGHSAFCELNYTPEKDGQIDIKRQNILPSNLKFQNNSGLILLTRVLLISQKNS